MARKKKDQDANRIKTVEFDDIAKFADEILKTEARTVWAVYSSYPVLKKGARKIGGTNCYSSSDVVSFHDDLSLIAVVPGPLKFVFREEGEPVPFAQYRMYLTIRGMTVLDKDPPYEFELEDLLEMFRER